MDRLLVISVIMENWNSLASFELNNYIKQHFFSAEIIFQNESKIYIQGSRNSKEFEKGTVTFTVNAASKEIKELMGLNAYMQ